MQLIVETSFSNYTSINEVGNTVILSKIVHLEADKNPYRWYLPFHETFVSLTLFHEIAPKKGHRHIHACLDLCSTV